jgi:hypothetical protein
MNTVVELIAQKGSAVGMQSRRRAVLKTVERRYESVKTTAERTGILFSLVAVFASSVLFTGCQTTVGGQTLPSPDYLSDDVQYFPAGPEFKLQNQVEAARKYDLERSQMQEQ